MPGLEPGIPARRALTIGMAGSSPAMTRLGRRPFTAPPPSARPRQLLGARLRDRRTEPPGRPRCSRVGGRGAILDLRRSGAACRLPFRAYAVSACTVSKPRHSRPAPPDEAPTADRQARRRHLWWATAFRSPVHLPEHDVERADHGGDVGEHVATAEEIHRLEVGEARRADLAAVGLVGAVGDEIDAELALRRLDRRIDLAGRHVEALGIELEVVDERLHRALHLAPLRRHDLVVLVRHRPLPFRQPQLFEALLHDTDRLAHLLHTDDLAVVVVAMPADRDVEIHLLVALVGLRLAQIPGGARAAHHHAREAPGPRVLERDRGDVDVALLEDAVADDELVEVVADLEEGVAERPDIVDELFRQVLVHAAGAEIVGVHARARGPLVEHHQLLALLKPPQRWSEGADVHR